MQTLIIIYIWIQLETKKIIEINKWSVSLCWFYSVFDECFDLSFQSMTFQILFSAKIQDLTFCFYSEWKKFFSKYYTHLSPRTDYFCHSLIQLLERLIIMTETIVKKNSKFVVRDWLFSHKQKFMLFFNLSFMAQVCVVVANGPIFGTSFHLINPRRTGFHFKCFKL